MNKWLAGLILLAVVVGCGQTGEVPEVLKITDREPSLDATGVVGTQTLSATFNFSLNHTGMTKDNLFSDYVALGSAHTAGNPSVTSLSFSPDSKTMRVEISQWIDPTSSSPVVHIVPREGKIKDVFNNVMRTTTRLWRYTPVRNIWGTVHFANTSLTMKNGMEVYYASVLDPSTKIGTAAASIADGTYALSGIEPGNYYVGITAANGWAATSAVVSIADKDSEANIDINLYSEDFDVLRTGSETLTAVISFGANRYAAGAGSAALYRSSDDSVWEKLPNNGSFTTNPLVWLFYSSGMLSVMDNTSVSYASATPEIASEWHLQPSGFYTEEAIVDFFIDIDDVGYVVTESGRLMITLGGSPLVWTDITPAGQHINAIDMARSVSTYEALICGDNGYVAQIDYEGNIVKDLRGDLSPAENLMGVASNLVNTPVSIYAVVSESGAVIKTEDGGVTWQNVISGVPCSLNDLAMFYYILPGQDFRDIWMYVVGSNGLIMRKKTGAN
jgi:hypothetical protein